MRDLLPLRLQPVARFHYERWRGLLERELPLFCSRIAPNDRVIDVGANVGVYVHALGRRGAIVEAFEPQPACAEVLLAYAASNPNIHVHTTALGSADSRAVLSVPLVGGRLARAWATVNSHDGNVGEEVSVQVRTLDSYKFDRVKAIKIDVEGAELDVIRGATETITKFRPMLLVEIEQRHHTSPIYEVFAHIEQLGYTGQVLLPGRGLRPIAEFRVDQHQHADARHNGNGNGNGHGVYVNNFLFTAS
jgi:FkbM family methyltransferase